MLGEISLYALVLLLGLISLGYLLFLPDKTPDFWLMLLIVGSLLLIGGGGMVLAYLQYGISRERRKAITQDRPALDLLKENVLSTDRFPSIPSDADIIDSPGTHLRYRLPRIEGAFWPMFAASLFGLSWLAVSVILLVSVINGIWNSQVDWLFVTLLLVSMLVTNWAARYFSRQMQLLLRVGMTLLEISHHPLLPGSDCKGFFFHSGSMKLRAIKLSLVCEEQATYRQGTDMRFESHRAFKQEISILDRHYLQSDQGLEHEFNFSIPESAMHSFRSEHNQVQWKLVAQIKPESLPRFKRSFLIIVHPGHHRREES